ncbi:hypothetical protein HanIR_Chr06g0295281 [Helianthus annuus]|nr:hypothetical protein HanIR_Chr06g0295281 [Helianthus annuus]
MEDLKKKNILKKSLKMNELLQTFYYNVSFFFFSNLPFRLCFIHVVLYNLTNE